MSSSAFFKGWAEAETFVTKLLSILELFLDFKLNFWLLLLKKLFFHVKTKSFEQANETLFRPR